MTSAGPPDTVVAHQPRLADHSADRRMLLLAARAFVGGTGGAASAWVLTRLIYLVTNLAWYGRLSAAPPLILDAAHGPKVVLIPVVGSLIVGLMALYGSEKIKGHGIPEAIEAILYGESRLSPKVALLKPISSAISIGSGGPFGAEGPIIMTGGAIGSLFAQRFRLTAAERKTLLVAGAAAGMTGIFDTPLASILLAIEVLLFEWKPRSFVPVVTAVLVSFGCRPLLLGTAPLFPFTAIAPIWWQAASGSILIGLLAGVEAVLLSIALYRVEDLFHRLPVHWFWWPAIGGVVVGLGGLIDGGVLAPWLMLGGALGVMCGQFLPGPAGFWAMAGMAGILSGAMRAPLTGALFAGEVTGHVGDLPAMVAASVGA